jgi:hypothetical protein
MTKKPNQSLEAPAHWENHIKQFKASNLNCKAYCKKHNISPHRFYYRYHKSKDKKPRSLIPVLLRDEQFQSHSSTALCRIELKGGHCISVHDSAILNDILKELL